MVDKECGSGMNSINSASTDLCTLDELLVYFEVCARHRFLSKTPIKLSETIADVVVRDKQQQPPLETNGNTFSGLQSPPLSAVGAL